MLTKLTVELAITTGRAASEAVAAIASRLDDKKKERYLQPSMSRNNLIPGCVRGNRFELYLYERSIKAEGEIYSQGNSASIHLTLSPYMRLYDKLMAIVLAILVNYVVTALFDFISLEIFFWMLTASVTAAVTVKKVYLFNSRKYQERFQKDAEYCVELVRRMVA